MLSTALTGVWRVYLDALPLIYYVEENPAYVARMEMIIAAIEKTPLQAISSVIILPEVLSHPLKLGRTDLVTAY